MYEDIDSNDVYEEEPITRASSDAPATDLANVCNKISQELLPEDECIGLP